MAEKRNYLRQWREHAELTQEELAEKIGTTKSVISLLENEKRPLSDDWLYKLAKPLHTRPGHILDYAPEDADAVVLQLFGGVALRDRATVLKIIRSFTSTQDK